MDIFSLQKLLGHTSLAIMRQYLAQNDEDTKQAHLKGSPVDGNIKNIENVCQLIVDNPLARLDFKTSARKSQPRQPLEDEVTLQITFILFH